MILAGGLGTRIRSISGSLPKALIPIAGIPFIFYQVEWLRRNSVDDIVVSTGYGSDQIRAALQARYRNSRISFCDEGSVLRGTAGALRFVGDSGLLQDNFLVLYGDSYLPIEIAPIWRTSSFGRYPTMSVLRNEGRWDRSNVLFRDGTIEIYDKQAPDPMAIGMIHIDYGLSVLQRDLIERMVPAGGVMDLSDIFGDLGRSGHLHGHEVSERFYEIGSIAGLRDFESYVANHPEIQPASS